jgi:hypothetical protein
MRLPELPEHEARYIRGYVNSQSQDDEAGLVQKVGSRRVMGRVHDMYDVHCERSRWWVITEPTNLYLQDDFPEVEQALIFHLGLGIFMAERSRAELPEAEEERVSGAWRRFKQALSDMDDAGESEDFQAVGIKCRDSLLAVVRDHMAAEWVGEVAEPPKVSDFKGWGNIFAERLAEGRVRSYIKALVDKTWDLSVWLQHNTNATPGDAELVLDATAHFLSALGRLIHRRDHGEPERCTRCGSYRLDEDVEMVDEPEPGMLVSTICGGCGWQSEQTFTSLVDHFRGKENAVIDYLSRPADGPSDRIHRKERREARDPDRD